MSIMHGWGYRYQHSPSQGILSRYRFFGTLISLVALVVLAPITSLVTLFKVCAVKNRYILRKVINVSIRGVWHLLESESSQINHTKCNGPSWSPICVVYSYLKLIGKPCGIPWLYRPVELANGNPDVCSSYLCVTTSDQFIQCSVDENVLSL
jgi:hypothetical protein